MDAHQMEMGCCSDHRPITTGHWTEQLHVDGIRLADSTKSPDCNLTSQLKLLYVQSLSLCTSGWRVCECLFWALNDGSFKWLAENKAHFYWFGVSSSYLIGGMVTLGVTSSLDLDKRLPNMRPLCSCMHTHTPSSQPDWQHDPNLSYPEINTIEFHGIGVQQCKPSLVPLGVNPIEHSGTWLSSTWLLALGKPTDSTIPPHCYTLESAANSKKLNLTSCSRSIANSLNLVQFELLHVCAYVEAHNVSGIQGMIRS